MISRVRALLQILGCIASNGLGMRVLLPPHELEENIFCDGMLSGACSMLASWLAFFQVASRRLWKKGRNRTRIGLVPPDLVTWNVLA
jgi:hypothetical protein